MEAPCCTCELLNNDRYESDVSGVDDVDTYSIDTYSIIEVKDDLV